MLQETFYFRLLLKEKEMEGVLGEEIVNLVLKFGEHGGGGGSYLFVVDVSIDSRAWDLSNELIKLGTVLESDTSNALLTGLARQDNFNRMNGLMAKMVEMDIQPNVVTFGILIYHTCKFRRVDAALEVLEKMSGGKESGGLSVSVESVVVIYNTLIDGLCKIGRQAEGLGLMERTRLQKGCSPDTITHNCLINGFCKAGEGQKGKELFDEMNKERVAPNVVTIDTLVGGMCRTWRVGRVVVEARRRGLRGNAVAYSAKRNGILQ
ncbi:hypothetical protein NC653_006691 [Populus alba x Populus x berolinensis]|uniref:Pentatricopeptide repeat-containing protein n=1 Tax=Populus alba x Populus x berolinensis TaxID=444605 RepID=A0AAD6RF37_9ROSI|nr:hypothetical protein NC653_006691 [Populus alba x Populus x berolinensis]